MQAAEWVYMPGKIYDKLVRINSYFIEKPKWTLGLGTVTSWLKHLK